VGPPSCHISLHYHQEAIPEPLSVEDDVARGMHAAVERLSLPGMRLAYQNVQEACRFVKAALRFVKARQDALCEEQTGLAFFRTLLVPGVGINSLRSTRLLLV